jgi:transcriptional regulator with XRE-family HTH domain
LQPLDKDRVKEWRNRRMLSQQEVADRAGTSLFTIQRIERGEGNVRPKTGRGVAAALGVPIEELLPKAQAPLFRELPDPVAEEGRRAGWQSVARVRSELLVGLAELWGEQLDKGQYDWETLKAIESAGFRLALNHTLEEKEMKRWLTPEQLAQLERAEKRYEAYADKVVGLLRDAAEQEKKRLSQADVIELERYVAEREAARRNQRITA